MQVGFTGIGWYTKRKGLGIQNPQKLAKIEEGAAGWASREFINAKRAIYYRACGEGQCIHVLWGQIFSPWNSHARSVLCEEKMLSQNAENNMQYGGEGAGGVLFWECVGAPVALGSSEHGLPRLNIWRRRQESVSTIPTSVQALICLWLYSWRGLGCLASVH